MSNNNFLDIFEETLKFKNIKIYFPITDASVATVILQLQCMQHEFEANLVDVNDRVITIEINSPGGSVTAGLALFDTIRHIQSLGTTIITVGIGLVASMATILLTAGTIRKATKNTMFLIHQPSVDSFGGTVTDVLIAAKQMQRTKEIISNILSESTHQPLERIAADIERDYFMNSNEALEYGIIDEIIEWKDDFNEYYM